ncbi:MAG TPA: hypothetical protein PKH52_03760 [bacterium]|nr:hypothetical protein [bacterium]
MSKKITQVLAKGLALLIIIFNAWPILTAAQVFSPEGQTGFTTIGEEAYGASTPKDVRLVVADTVQIVLGLIGIILVVLMIIAGIQYMTAGGNQTTVENAIKRIKNALIGLIIVLFSYAVTVFIIQQLNLAINSSIT